MNGGARVGLVATFFVLYANGAFWISERIPYLHMILMPLSNRWLSSLVVLTAIGGYLVLHHFDGPEGEKRRVLKNLWYLSLITYAISLIWWIFIYITGGI